MSVFEPLLYSQIVILIFSPVDFFLIILIDLKNPAAHRGGCAFFFKIFAQNGYRQVARQLGNQKSRSV